MTEASARGVATRVLHRVAVDAAWASVTLDAEIQRARLDARDAALASEIVYGALRVLPALDRAIARVLDRPRTELDDFARAALRGATYQILHLERVPPSATVDETVELVKGARGERLASFCNAVLRKVSLGRAEAPTRPRAMSIPDWVRDSLKLALGEVRARAFLESRAMPPYLGLRVREGAESIDEVLATLAAARPEAELVRGLLAPRAILARGLGDARALEAWRSGLITVQEEGSQLVALSLGVGPGEKIVDACAGHGGKTTVFAEAVGEGGEVLALDLYEEKLERIAPELARLRLDPGALSVEAVDLTVGTGGFEARFDRVMVDAPCTGLGTIHRRPEILLRLTEGAAREMAALQLEILTNAARLVRPGGLLAYAVCSPSVEEGRGVVEAFEARHPRFERIRSAPLPTVPIDEDGIARIGPWLARNESGASDAGTDAYQIARWGVPPP